MIKVSIIVPVYNAEKSIQRCLESLVRQTYENIEILLINDGSTDSSEKICAAYEKNYPFIHLISQNNSGPATARNKGIDLATGDYICFVDADDYVEPNYISAMADVAKDSDADMVICGYYEENDSGSKVHTFKYKTGLYEDEAARNIAVSLISDVSEKRIPPYSWVRMSKIKVFNMPKIRYADGMMRSEDYYLYTQIHFRIRKVYILSDSPLYHYCENNMSVTHSYVGEYWRSVIEIYSGLEEGLPKEAVIQKNLNIMLIQRSMIALNNSSKAPDVKTFRAEVLEILKDGNLKKALQDFTIREGFNRFGLYYLLMNIGFREIVFLRYAIKRLEKRKE